MSKPELVEGESNGAGAGNRTRMSVGSGMERVNEFETLPVRIYRASSCVYAGVDVDVVIEVAMMPDEAAPEAGSQGLPGVAIVDSGRSCGVVFSVGGLIQACRGTTGGCGTRRTPRAG